MTLRHDQYMCPAFAGVIVEGTDDELYALDVSNGAIYKIGEHCRLCYVDSVERGYAYYKSGRGYVVLLSNHDRHVWKIYSIPSMECFHIRVPHAVVYGYNSDSKIAILYDTGSSNLMLFDCTRKRRNIRHLGFIAGLGAINDSRMLAASYANDKIKISDIVNNRITIINPSRLGISFVGFLYPLSETVVIAYGAYGNNRYGTTILSPDKIIFSMFGFNITSLSNVDGRVVINIAKIVDFKYYRRCIYGDISRNMYCCIDGARYAVAVKRGLAVQLASTKAWCIIDDDGSLLDRASYIEFSPANCSSVIVAQSYTI